MRSRTARVIQRKPVLVRVGYHAVIKQDQKMEERVYLASTIKSLLIIGGSQDRKSTGQEPEAGYGEVRLK